MKTITAKTFYQLLEASHLPCMDEARICSVCGHLMTDGHYVFDDYACSDECLSKLVTDEEYEEYTCHGDEEEYENSMYFDEFYWSEWYPLGYGKDSDRLIEAMLDSNIDWRSNAPVPVKIVRLALKAIYSSTNKVNALEAYVDEVCNGELSTEAMEAFDSEYVGSFATLDAFGEYLINKGILEGEIDEYHASDLDPSEVADSALWDEGYHKLKDYYFKEA